VFITYLFICPLNFEVRKINSFVCVGFLIASTFVQVVSELTPHTDLNTLTPLLLKLDMQTSSIIYHVVDMLFASTAY